MDVFLKPYRRKIAVAATRMASRCGEPGALLLFTFIGQSRFDEIGCRASRSASPSGCREDEFHARAILTATGPKRSGGRTIRRNLPSVSANDRFAPIVLKKFANLRFW